jgi:hypothetical protein
VQWLTLRKLLRIIGEFTTSNQYTPCRMLSCHYPIEFSCDGNTDLCKAPVLALHQRCLAILG